MSDIRPDAGQGCARHQPLVLLVDDDRDLRDTISGLLVPEYRVLSAADGREALDLAREHVPDLVLTGVMMPRMSGIEFAQALRCDPTTVGVPIIFLSAPAGGEASVDGLEMGSEDCLHDPFTAQELLSRVRSHLRLARSRRAWAAELQSANHELDTFSYSVAHDLRGPLRSINGFSDILLQEHAQSLNDEGRRLLDIVRASAARMSQLIDDLLRLSRMTRGDLRRIPFDLSSIVRTVALQIEEGDHERQVALHVEPGVTVHADPHMLHVVLDNLLRNAWKFTAGRADARIEFGSERTAGEQCYYVRDNGAGFNMDHAAKLFGVFQRLHTESEFPGTGVGLATVRRIIGRHGGRVWATATVGAGATFYFTLGAAGCVASPGHSSAVA